MGLLLQNGTCLTENNVSKKQDILIENGKIVRIGENLPNEGQQIIDCQGQHIIPGLIDLHVHLREPGFEAKETIETGTKAAAKGGFTTVCCMPNTHPPLDDAGKISSLRDQIEAKGRVHVLPIGAITINQQGEQLTDFSAMKEAGIIAVSDDGVGVQSSWMMKQAMLQAKALNLPVVAHCEDDTLIQGGAVHEGRFSISHHIPGIPSEAESIHVGRDILLSEATGARYHVCHISTKESVRLVRDAKQRGVPVTAEVTPHHLLLCEDDIPGEDTDYKMNPPLRGREDQQALLEGLVDGTIDIIATDHAPHTKEDKAQNMQQAPFGIVGLETALPLLYTHLVQTGKMTWASLIDKMTTQPARVFGLPRPSLAEGQIADLTVIDVQQKRPIERTQFASKGKNTPFQGWHCAGWPVVTVTEGNIVWSAADGFIEKGGYDHDNHRKTV